MNPNLVAFLRARLDEERGRAVRSCLQVHPQGDVHHPDGHPGPVPLVDAWSEVLDGWEVTHGGRPADQEAAEILDVERCVMDDVVGALADRFTEHPDYPHTVAG